MKKNITVEIEETGTVAVSFDGLMLNVGLEVLGELVSMAENLVPSDSERSGFTTGRIVDGRIAIIGAPRISTQAPRPVFFDAEQTGQLSDKKEDSRRHADKAIAVLSALADIILDGKYAEGEAIAGTVWHATALSALGDVELFGTPEEFNGWKLAIENIVDNRNGPMVELDAPVFDFDG